MELLDPTISIETLPEFSEALESARQNVKLIPVYYFENEWDLFDDEEWLD